MIERLSTVVYPVTDLAAATAWYSSVLQCAPYFEQPFYVGFQVGGFELGLVPDGTPGAAGGTAYWGTPDIVAEMARLSDLGAAPHEAISDVGDGIKVGAVQDPDGNVFGLIENPHFKAAKVG